MAAKYSLSQIKDDIDDFLRTEIFPGQTVYAQSMGDDTILEPIGTSSRFKPYVARQFGDIQQWGATSFAGAIGDDYVLPLYLKVVVNNDGSSAGIPTGEKLSDMATMKMLGASFEWTGEIRKRLSGVQTPIEKGGSVMAIAFPLSFGLLIQLSEIEDFSS